MTDPFAAVVTALTHAGFRGAKPVSRKEWGPLLGGGASSSEELQDRIAASPHAACLEGLPAVEAELVRLTENGVWALTQFAEGFPVRWKKRLAGNAPPVVFGMGPVHLLSTHSLAIVGSRDASAEALDFASASGRAAAKHGWAVVSGGARGVDLAGVQGGCSVGGNAVVIAADAIGSVYRKLLSAGCEEGSLVVATANHPNAGFTVGLAMARNKLVYSLADASVVVSCEEGSGGTWAGAIEALKEAWLPVGVWSGVGAPAGNSALEERGAIRIEECGELFEMRSAAAQATLFEA